MFWLSDRCCVWPTSHASRPHRISQQTATTRGSIDRSRHYHFINITTTVCSADNAEHDVARFRILRAVPHIDIVHLPKPPRLLSVRTPSGLTVFHEVCYCVCGCVVSTFYIVFFFRPNLKSGLVKWPTSDCCVARRGSRAPPYHQTRNLHNHCKLFLSLSLYILFHVCHM
jgi:hypothetical protein